MDNTSTDKAAADKAAADKANSQLKSYVITMPNDGRKIECYKLEKQMEYSAAEKAAKDSVNLEHNDWRLPTKDELREILTQLPPKGSLTEKLGYWTIEKDPDPKNINYNLTVQLLKLVPLTLNDWGVGKSYNFINVIVVRTVSAGDITNLGNSSGTEVTVTDSGTTASNETVDEGINPTLGGYVIPATADIKKFVVATQNLLGGDKDNKMNFEDAQTNIKKAENHSQDGAKFNDWRLPSKEELNLIYGIKDKIGGFNRGFYYSATIDEKNILVVGIQGFSNGTADNTGNTNKRYKQNIRAVRTI